MDDRGLPAAEENHAWRLSLIAGVLMIIVAFWTSGQFFIEKAYTLLVFAGIWSLMRGYDRHLARVPDPQARRVLSATMSTTAPSTDTQPEANSGVGVLRALVIAHGAFNVIFGVLLIAIPGRTLTLIAVLAGISSCA